ncbi:MAG: helix-turn-helix transcriptional regulator [Candidatus Kariarchaeaceae archaeon]
MEIKLKVFRAIHDLTQEALAKKLKVRRETISHIEKGKYNPSLKLALKIARILKTSIEEIFIISDEELFQDI